MAFVDGVKNAVAAQVAARANRAIRSGLTKVAGNLLGINTQFDGPQLGHHQDRAPHYIKTRFDTKSLTYPIDVEEDPRQGHYIYFVVNQQSQAELDIQAKKLGIEAYNEILAIEVGISRAEEHAAWVEDPHGPIQIRSKKAHWQQAAAKLGLDGFDTTTVLEPPRVKGAPFGSGRKSSSSLRLRNAISQTAISHIALYMPGSVQVSYGADYQDTEIGVFADMGAGAIQAFKEGADFRKTVETMVETGSVGFKKALLATLDVVAPGSKAVAQIISGKAITPKMELMFNGIGRREFSYEFTFMPRSAEEAESVQDIVKEFKLHMSANFTKENSFREMYLPHTFSISYQYMGQPNDNLHKISECVLESANVTYGGDRYQTHAGGVPQTTKLALKFKELEIITRDMVDDGY